MLILGHRSLKGARERGGEGWSDEEESLEDFHLSARLYSESLYLSARQPDTRMDGSAIESMSASVRLQPRKAAHNEIQQIPINFICFSHCLDFSLYMLL